MKLPKIPLWGWIVGGAVVLLVMQKSKVKTDAVVGGMIVESGSSAAEFRNLYKPPGGRVGGFKYLRV